jgi:hypothetical protein
MQVSVLGFGKPSFIGAFWKRNQLADIMNEIDAHGRMEIDRPPLRLGSILM